MSAIKFNNVSKSFSKTIAVNRNNLSVERGEIFGFLGPNGAGKTTSIRCLMDFIRPDVGTIEVLGMDSRRDSVTLKSKIGYLSAEHHLHNDWTGKEHIQFVSQLRNLKSTTKNLSDKLVFDPTVKVKNLSTGNRQKLAIILAYLGEPELIIMDEPTQGLDPILQNQFYIIAEDYSKAGGTIFMSSHNLTEVERLCQSVAIINKGKIVNEETLESLKAKSMHKITLSYKQPISYPFGSLKNVSVVSKSSNGIVFKVSGSLDEILHQISMLPIKDIEIVRANLDEIFMEYYND